MTLVGHTPLLIPREEADDRRTPSGFFLRLHGALRFTVDAAASEENALLPLFWTRELDGLAQPWKGHRVWCNPPFSGIAPWVQKAWHEMIYGRCELVAMLLPANRCEQPWWQDHVEPYRDTIIPRQGVRLSTCFLRGRMKFGFVTDRPKPAKGWRPPFGCVLLTWRHAGVSR